MNDREYIEEMKRLGALNANLRAKNLECENKVAEVTYFHAKQAEMLIDRNNKLLADYDFWRREAISSKAELGEIKIAQYRNGWIPCSERLPSKEEYLKDDGRFIATDENRRYQSLFNIYEKRFEKEMHDIRMVIEDKCVLAWQPLPETWKE